MSLETILEDIGFSSAEAIFLSRHEYFKHKRKTKEELEDLFHNITTIYECSDDVIKKAVLKHPQFAGYDHHRVITEAAAEYGDADAVKKAVLKFPPFAGLDHQRVVEEATAVYGNEEAVKKAVLKHPQFAGYDHHRVLRQKTKLGRMAGLER
ncbi:MAG: hypothetical protein Q8R37_05775, partial [Nanoarchaeota archaeon]|nr:hypothetical protein [Nanoarchaeota archaeon]